jgi:glycosyltransferase involved in cell wall biosynthesis
MFDLPVKRANSLMTPSMSTPSAAPGAPAYMFVVPWDTHHVGGVNGVVLNLAQVMRVETALRPIIAINDWSAVSTQSDTGDLRFRFSPIAPSPAGLLKGLSLLPLRLWQLRRFLRVQGVQVVNFHYVGESALGVALLKRFGLFDGKLVLSVHGADVKRPQGWVARLVYATIFYTADVIVAVSKGLAERAIDQFRLSPSRVSIIYNGVDHSVFNPDAATRTVADSSLPASYLASVGRYIPRKDHACLLQAFARISEAYKDLHLCIAGDDGPGLAPLREESERLGLASRVHLLHSLSPAAVAHLLARAVACVQPSLSEGFPLTTLEAAATGTPLVVSNIPGHDEIVEDQVSGLLFPVKDSAACAVAMERILRDPQFARRMADTQRARTLAMFTWSRCLTAYLDIIGITPSGSAQSHGSHHAIL